MLPVYAFWHFDDFSWGETRKVEGEGKDLGHAVDSGAALGYNAVPLRRWEDWERSRLRKTKRDEKRKREFERSFGGAKTASTLDSRLSTKWDSETASLATSGEEDTLRRSA